MDLPVVSTSSGYRNDKPDEGPAGDELTHEYGDGSVDGMGLTFVEANARHDAFMAYHEERIDRDSEKWR